MNGTVANVTDQERVYVLQRQRSGRYALLTNDRRWVLLIERYQEDGTLVRGTWPNETPIYGTFWQVGAVTLDEFEDDPLRVASRPIEQSLSTRRAAVQAGLRWAEVVS